MSSDAPAYGLWSLVIVNSVVFILFAYSFFKPRTGRDWRSFGAFSAFLVALFAEMYGFPLSIYFLSGWLQLSFVLIGGGFVLIAAAWRALFDAQQRHILAITGPYSHIRHPQYVGFILVMLGFLVQWPTLLTLAMFPVLVWMYVRLARQEERDVRAEFGEAYDRYAARTPAWFPRLGGAGSAHSWRA